MIYATCPTCGYVLASKASKYELEKDKICSNPDFTEIEQGEQISQLIKSLGLRRYCCKMRIMTCKDIVQDIVPVSNNF
jgi:DNA-directed RNA polymerase subunit N (RpoN/RPB10)